MQVAATANPDVRTGSTGDVDALIDRPRLSALQIRVFIACALVLFCDGYDLQALALAVPSISAEIGIPASAFSTALSASLFGMAIGGVLFAPLGDRIGRKPMLVLSMVLVGGSTLAAILHVSTGWIAFCRLLTGIGMAMAGVNAAALSGAFALQPDGQDAALVATLLPGAYTVQVSGLNNTTGLALVEVYEVP